MVFEYLDKRFGNPNFYGVGLSMGANVMCRTNQKAKADCRIKAQVCIATPFDGEIIADNLNRFENSLYDSSLLELSKALI